MSRISMWVLVITALGLSAWAAMRNDVGAPSAGDQPGARVMILVIDGIRHADAFEGDGRKNMPHMWKDLGPQGAMFEVIRMALS